MWHSLIRDKSKMAPKNNDMKIGCIISHTAQVFRAKKLICNVFLKNIIRYNQISDLSQLNLKWPQGGYAYRDFAVSLISLHIES